MSGTNAHAAQLDAEIVGQASPAAWAAQLVVEVICTAPPLPARFSRERNFPLGFRNFPPRAGSWRTGL